MPLKITGDEIIAEWEHISFRKKKLSTNKEWEYISRKNNEAIVVCVLWHIENRRFIFLRQYRYALEDYVIWPIAWVVEWRMSLEDALKKEIYEESWYTEIISMEKISVCSSQAGLSSELSNNYFVCVSWEPQKQKLEETEDIEVLEVDENSIIEYLEEQKDRSILDPQLGLIIYRCLALQKLWKN